MSAASFAVAARRLGDSCRRLGLTVPAFRSPPRTVGVDRTVRRLGEHVTVSVRSDGRPWAAVVADLVEGVVVANELAAVDAARVRRELWASVETADVPSRSAA